MANSSVAWILISSFENESEGPNHDHVYDLA
jgi:hypothetical protein